MSNLPEKEKEWQVSPNNAAATGEGGSTDNQRTLLEIKNQLITPAQSPWTVLRSSDSTVVTGDLLLPASIPDSSGNGNDGTPFGSLSSSRVLDHTINLDAFTRDSYRLTRSSDYIDIPYSTDLDPEKDETFSISCWVKPDTVSASNVMLAKYDNTLGGWIFRFVSGGFLEFVIGISPNFWRIQTDDAYDDGAWHHVVATCDGTEGASSLSIYVDGELVSFSITEDDVIAGSIQHNTPINIGRWDGQTNVGYQGAICEVAFHSIALNQSQVTELYNNGITQDLRQLSFASSIVSWWRCGTWDVILYPDTNKQLVTADRILRDSDGYDEVNVLDFSSYGNEGTYQNIDASDFSLDTPGGIAQYSVDFNGVDQYASVTSSSELIKGGSVVWALSCWIKVENSSASAGQIIGKYLFSSPTRSGYGLDMDSSGRPRLKINLSESGNLQHLVQANQDIRDGYWHHIVGTNKKIGTNNHVTNIYIDGVDVSTTVIRSNIGNSSINSSNQPFTIGALDASQLQLEAKITECSLWGKNLREHEVLQLYNGGEPGNLWEVSFVNHLQGWWRLGPPKGNFGQNVSFDYFGKRPDSPESTSGQFSTACILFDGNNDGINMGNILDKTGDDSFSVSAWIYYAGNLSATIISKFNSTAGPGWVFNTGSFDGTLFRFTGTGTLIVETAEGQATRTGGEVFIHNWHHVAFTYEGGSFDQSGVSIYVDGYLQTNANVVDSFSANGGTTATLRIGITEFGSNDFPGYIDEVSMWSKALTEDEILEIYNGGTPSDLTLLDGYADGYLDAWWRLEGEEAPADTWQDNTNLVWSTSNRSWIVLEKPSTGAQLLFDLNSSSSTDLFIAWSPEEGFRGGSTGSRPVAVDEIILQANNVDWNNGYSTYSSWVSAWHTTDGKQTRIIVSTNQADPTVFWVFDEIEDSFSSSWTNPEIFCIFENTNALNRDNISQPNVLNTIARGYDGYVGNFNVIWCSLGNDSTSTGGTNWITEQNWGAVENELVSTGGYHFASVVLASEAEGAKGVLGILKDIWWSADAVDGGTTFPDDPNDRQFAKFGQLVLPWTEGSEIPFFAPNTSSTPDLSGNGNDGTIIGATLSTDVAGAGSFSTRSLNFSNNRVNMGNPPELDFTTEPFSISVWFKTSLNATRSVVEKLDASFPNPGYGLAVVSDGTIVFNVIRNVSTSRINVKSAANNLLNGQWHHVLVTYDGSSNASGVTVYIDGSLDASSILQDNLTGSYSTTTAFQIGARDTTSLPFFGNIDDVVVFSRELTSSEASYVYNGGEPGDILTDGYFDGYLAGYWQLGDQLPVVADNTADGIFVGSGAAISASERVTNYYMVGIDSGAPPGPPVYVYWTVQNTPDLAGTFAPSPPFGGPLINIEINAQFETVVNNV